MPERGKWELWLGNDSGLILMVCRLEAFKDKVVVFCPFKGTWYAVETQQVELRSSFQFALCAKDCEMMDAMRKESQKGQKDETRDKT